MTAINKDKRSTNYIRIRKLLQKNDFSYNRNNKTSNRTYKKEH